MRLFHESLIPHLPRQQLLGQHRECAALRGLGWGRKHSTVDYVFRHSYAMLFSYHIKVMEEMVRRGYKVAYPWTVSQHRGKRCGEATQEFYMQNHSYADKRDTIYPEHNEAYLQECLGNLAGKGVVINMREGIAP